MHFHYALVDDLITKEEFERRVEVTIEACGDLVDEPTAAMMVVGELGREHVKIRGLAGKSSLFSFFGKVLDKSEPREFARADGEKGWVASLLLGDETGTVRVVLWDEKAGAVADTAAGDVLEVIGRHPKSGHEIYALALRKAGCEITCATSPGTGPGSLSAEPVALDAVLLSAGSPRTFSKRDGSSGEMAEAVIGTAGGTFRLVAWVPALITGLPAGTTIHITNAKPNNRGDGESYSIDEKSTITVIDRQIPIPFTPLHSVADQGTYSVRGEVKEARQPRTFTTRDGRSSWVRNLVIHDADDELNVVLWGEAALRPVSSGDRVEIYHATAKPGRSGSIELGVGRGSVFRVPEEESRPITFSGTIIAGPGCLFIDDGRERYLIDGQFAHGTEVTVTGLLAGNRIIPEHSEPVPADVAAILEEIRAFRDRLKA